ncbi:MAG: DUF4926 domain-containing protein [bacterium]
MIREHDIMVLVGELPEHGLKEGDLGTVIHVHRESAGYEVEFMTLCGETVAVETLEKEKVRPVERHEMHHARPMQKQA